MLACSLNLHNLLTSTVPFLCKIAAMSSSMEVPQTVKTMTAYKYHNGDFPETDAILWSCAGKVSFMTTGNEQTPWHGSFKESFGEIRIMFDRSGNEPLNPVTVYKFREGRYHGLDHKGREITLSKIYTSLWDEVDLSWRRTYQCSVCKQFSPFIEMCGVCSIVKCIDCVHEECGCNP